MSETGDQRRQFGVISLTFIAFFWVSGGLYGNEALLLAAPISVVLILLLVTAVVYALPLSLISLELTAALPLDGGGVAWIERGFGKLVAGHNTYWTILVYVFDSAIYPVLAGWYMREHFDFTVFGDGIYDDITV